MSNKAIQFGMVAVALCALSATALAKPQLVYSKLPGNVVIGINPGSTLPATFKSVTLTVTNPYPTTNVYPTLMNAGFLSTEHTFTPGQSPATAPQIYLQSAGSNPPDSSLLMNYSYTVEVNGTTATFTNATPFPVNGGFGPANGTQAQYFQVGPSGSCDSYFTGVNGTPANTLMILCGGIAPNAKK